MRIFDTIIALLFVGIAMLQLNDPDPAYWVIVYGVTALLGFAAAVGRFSYYWTAINTGAVAGGMLLAFSGFVAYFLSYDFQSITGAMLPEKPWVEPAREFLGLGIALVALLWYQHRASPKKEN
jgi:hypothetical protein